MNPFNPTFGVSPARSDADYQVCRTLEQDGHLILRGLFSADEIMQLREEILNVYKNLTPVMRVGSTTPAVGEMYRYDMFNHSARCQKVIADPRILAVIEPLLGTNCHVIACTSWRNPPGRDHAPNGQQWHVDGRLHVPHSGTPPWPDHIPYPIYVISTHIFLEDCEMKDGPTACISGSHKAGCLPARDRVWELHLTWNGIAPESHVARAGDVSFRVSDVWHRRMPPAEEASGRFFLQTAYGRREIAQRLRPTEDVNFTTPESRARATTDRARQLIGLHRQGYYDS